MFDRGLRPNRLGNVKGRIMDEKKRERLMKIFRVVALILAVLMIAGIIFQAFIY